MEVQFLLRKQFASNAHTSSNLPAHASVFTRMGKGNYITLDHHQKRLILAEAIRCRTTQIEVTVQELPIWAHQHFGLEIPPNHSTKTRLLKPTSSSSI